MHPASFEYYAPVTLDEALAILERFDGEAKVLAGGQSLIPLSGTPLHRCPTRSCETSAGRGLARARRPAGGLGLLPPRRRRRDRHTELRRDPAWTRGRYVTLR